MHCRQTRVFLSYQVAGKRKNPQNASVVIMTITMVLLPLLPVIRKFDNEDIQYLPNHKPEDKPHDKAHQLSKRILRLLATDSSQCSPCNQTDFRCLLSAENFQQNFIMFSCGVPHSCASLAVIAEPFRPERV